MLVKIKTRDLLILLAIFVVVTLISTSTVTKQYNWNAWYTGWIRGDSASITGNANITGNLAVGNDIDVSDTTLSTISSWKGYFDSLDASIITVNKMKESDLTFYVNTGSMFIQNDGKIALTNSTTPFIPQNMIHTYNNTASITGERISNSASGNTATDGTLYGIDASANTYIWNFENTPILFGANNVEVFRFLALGGQVSRVSDTTQIVAATGLTATMFYPVLRVVGTTGGTDISANPQIVDGTNGQEIEIHGCNDTRTVKFDDGTGLQLAGGLSFTLGLGDVLVLRYMSATDLWTEISRSDN